MVRQQRRSRKRCNRIRRQKMTKRRVTKATREKKSSKKSSFQVAVYRLKKLKAHQQRKALEIASPKFVHHLCNEVKKLRHQKLKPALSKKLHKHAANLRKLVGKRTPLNSKREILTQRGGLIGALLAGLAPSLLGFAAKAVSNLIGHRRR